jgi:predicted AAA+ superfamily ATPase
LTERGAEVDFIVEHSNKLFCIEVKSSVTPPNSVNRGLTAFRSFYGKKCEQYVFYRGHVTKEIDGVSILPWQDGMKKIGF